MTDRRPPTVARGWSPGASSRARGLVLAAGLLPMLAWPMSAGRLVRPLEAMAWLAVFAVLMAAAPGRALRAMAYAQCLLLPMTLSWIGTVASTGTGPSVSSMESLSAGAYGEVVDALGVALHTRGFQIVGSLTVLATLGGAWLARRNPVPRSGPAGLLFLLMLMPASATVLEGSALAWVSRAVGSEARVAVPWLFQIEVGKEALGELIDSRFARTGGAEAPLRAARDARADFQAEPGLAVLIVGESLRTDALIRPERGAASQALQQRLEQGLGLRLPDVCAGGNGTFVSVPKLLTMTLTPDPAQAVGRPTVLAIARAAGAQTAYFNNHEVWVVPESGHDLARKFSSAYFTSLDEVAIEALEDFVRSGAHPRRAAILHLYGQHFHYQERYPPGLFGPEPDGLTVATLAELRYHRAAEYGTKNLLRVARLLDSVHTPAYAIFTSDHGENLPSDATGREYHAGPINGRHDTFVPALVLWNRAFADSGRAQRLQPLREAVSPIAQRDLARAWLALMGAPDGLRADLEPQTWGSLQVGERAHAVPCAALGP